MSSRKATKAKKQLLELLFKTWQKAPSQNFVRLFEMIRAQWGLMNLDSYVSEFWDLKDEQLEIVLQELLKKREDHP
jgi:hypothetical protein